MDRSLVVPGKLVKPNIDILGKQNYPGHPILIRAKSDQVHPCQIRSFGKTKWVLWRTGMPACCCELLLEPIQAGEEFLEKAGGEQGRPIDTDIIQLIEEGIRVRSERLQQKIQE
ncbi:MAG: hypothetical protein ACK2TT_01410 [Anaerolineales bacterium]